MSKFIDALTTAGQKSPTPMGFGSASGRGEGNPQIVLAARVLVAKVAKNPRLAEAHADAFLLGNNPTAPVAKALKDRVWGVRAERWSADEGKRLIDSGCDFVVFESMDTEAGLLNEEHLGVVVTVNPEMGEEAIRALSELPVDGILFSPALRELPLTVGTAVEIQKVLGLMEKPLIVEAPDGIGRSDIELLRNLGVGGLFVGLDDMDHMDRVARIKADIQALPRPKPRRREHGALVPSSAGQGEVHDHSVDDDDDDDDF